MDIANMKPAGKQKASAKPAAVGVAGSALGILIVKGAYAQAETEVKQAESRKDTVLRLMKFTRDDHLEFRKVLNDTLDTFKQAAESMNLTLQAFKENDPKVNSVSVTVSLWRKMSEAIDIGFKPDMSDSWAALSLKATETLQSKASDGTTDNPSAVNPSRKKGRKATSALDKIKGQIETLPLQDKEKLALWLTALIESK
jgi:hypothetical protein